MDGSGYISIVVVVVVSGLLLAVVYGTVTKWHERVRNNHKAVEYDDRYWNE